MDAVELVEELAEPLAAGVSLNGGQRMPPSQTTTWPSAWIEIVICEPRGSVWMSTGNISSGSAVTPLVGKRVSTFAVTPACRGELALLLLGPRDERLDDAAGRRAVAPADLDRERLLVPGVGRELGR